MRATSAGPIAGMCPDRLMGVARRALESLPSAASRGKEAARQIAAHVGLGGAEQVFMKVTENGLMGPPVDAGIGRGQTRCRSSTRGSYERLL